MAIGRNLEAENDNVVKRLTAVERTLGGYSDIMTQILNKYQTVTEALERCEQKYDTILQKMDAFTKAK